MGTITNKVDPHADRSFTEPAPSSHQPVLLAEVVTALEPLQGKKIFDGTFGGGGYTEAILNAGAACVVATDLDPAAEARAATLSQTQPALTFIKGNFADIAAHAQTAGIKAFDGIVLDLGISSYQLDDAERGMAFRLDGPLDMRMGDSGPTAADILNSRPEAELADIFYYYGEERKSRRLAKLIVDQRREQKFVTTADLLKVVEQLHPRQIAGRRHPAQRLFQALRMAVNEELKALEQVLPAAMELLAPGGVLAVVSFHSLEDRIVKHTLRDAVQKSDAFKLRTKKPISPTEEEIAANVRARSGKLRVLERV